MTRRRFVAIALLHFAISTLLLSSVVHAEQEVKDLSLELIAKSMDFTVVTETTRSELPELWERQQPPSPVSRRTSTSWLSRSSSVVVLPNCTSLVNCSHSPTETPPQFSDVDMSDMGTTSSLDILVAALFLIAAGWLVLAIIYSVLIICIVRMRARSDMDLYDENFGRLYLCPCICGEQGYCYIPLGCILRRHIIALHRAQEQSQAVRIMSREERRQAMEQLLERATVPSTDSMMETNLDNAPQENGCVRETLSESIHSEKNNIESQGDLESCEEPVCSICLMEYGTSNSNARFAILKHKAF